MLQLYVCMIVYIPHFLLYLSAFCRLNMHVCVFVHLRVLVECGINPSIHGSFLNYEDPYVDVILLLFKKSKCIVMNFLVHSN